MIIVFQQLLLLLEHLILGVLNGFMDLQIDVLVVAAVFGLFQLVSGEFILNYGVLVETGMECAQPLDVQHYAGAQGGFYNAKMLTVCPGWQYTICAAGVHPCASIECYACDGCASYVNGCNLSNFCAMGGDGGCANGSWNEACFSDWGRCCAAPGAMGGDFGMNNHRGAMFIHASQCHCHCQGAAPTAAPFIGTQVQTQIQ